MREGGDPKLDDEVRGWVLLDAEVRPHHAAEINDGNIGGHPDASLRSSDEGSIGDDGDQEIQEKPAPAPIAVVNLSRYAAVEPIDSNKEKRHDAVAHLQQAVRVKRN